MNSMPVADVTEHVISMMVKSKNNQEFLVILMIILEDLNRKIYKKIAKI